MICLFRVFGMDNRKFVISNEVYSLSGLLNPLLTINEKLYPIPFKVFAAKPSAFL